MEQYSSNHARTLFGDSVESNVVVAAALMLLTVLATEFVINFEVRQIRDRRRRNDIVNKRRTLRRKFNDEEWTENKYSKQRPGISMQSNDPHLTMSQSEDRPIYLPPRRFVKKSDKIKLTLEEKELSKRLLSIYFNRLNKLIENN